ncbi:MAG: nucleotidyltransferase domain-containing protein [Candidatus Jordarchaeales archaeon]
MDLDAVTRKFVETCREYADHVGFAVVFGSAVNGSFSPASDVDIAVYFLGDKKEAFELLKKVSGRLGERFDVKLFSFSPSTLVLRL